MCWRHSYLRTNARTSIYKKLNNQPEDHAHFAHSHLKQYRIDTSLTNRDDRATLVSIDSIHNSIPSRRELQ